MISQLRIFFMRVGLVLTILFSVNAINAEIQEERGEKATPGINWNVEIYNKSKLPVLIHLETMGQVFTRDISASGKWRLANVDTNKTLKFRLSSLQGHSFEYTLTPEGKTVFLSFTPNQGVYPQTGTLFGLSGKTDSGLDNKNNIKKIDMKKR